MSAEILRSLLRHRADVQRAVRTTAATGVSTITWTTIAQDVMCSVQPVSVQQDMLQGRETLPYSHVVYVEASQDIDDTDRLVIGTTAYEVVSATQVMLDPAGMEAGRPRRLGVRRLTK